MRSLSSAVPAPVLLFVENTRAAGTSVVSAVPSASAKILAALTIVLLSLAKDLNSILPTSSLSFN